MGGRSRAQRREKQRLGKGPVIAKEIASERATKVYVYNLHSNVTDEHIPEIFKDVGELNQPAVHYDKTGKSMGSAELVFQNYSKALGFLKRYHGFTYKGKALKFGFLSDFVPSLEGGCDSSCESGALRLSTSLKDPAPFKTPTTTSKPDQGFVLTETQFGGKKHLYVCIVSFSQSQWHLKVASIAAHSLVMVNAGSYSEDEHVTNLLQLNPVIDVSKEAKDLFFGVNLISVSNMIYSFGGALSCPEEGGGPGFFFRPLSSNCMAYSLSVRGNHGSGHVLPHNRTECHGTLIEPMGSEKPFPVMAEIDGSIYIMCGGCGDIVADPFFEVYDPRKGTWRHLADPPFVVKGKDGKRLVVSNLRTYSHFVFEKKLCVSTETNSFSFDTASEKWESCDLFLGFENCYIGGPSFYCSVLKDSRVTGGPSFYWFDKIIVCFDDTLICSSIMDLVAFLVVDGKVRKMQYLSKVKQHLENAGCLDLDCDNLVYLGGGYICYQFCAFETFDCSKLKCVTFKISKIGGAGDGPDTDFLQFDYLKTSTLIQDTQHIIQSYMPQPYLFMQ